MANGDLIKLGTVYINNFKNARPTKPWYRSRSNGYGNLSVYSDDDKVCIEIRNTDPEDSYKIYWREVNIGSRKFLICDRNLVSTSWNTLNSNNLIYGKVINIDGQQYNLRLLSGGTLKGYGNNEWSDIICNKGNYDGLPVPLELDLESFDSANPPMDKRSGQFNGVHNKFWNWFEMSSVTSSDTGYVGTVTSRGDSSCNLAKETEKYWNSSGWRPVLEVLNIAPVISDVDKSLGDKNIGFSISYQVNDLNNDSLTIVEKLNGNTLRFLNNAPKSQDIVINISNEQLYLLPLNVENKISIEVNDGKGGMSYRNYTFKRTNSAPIISNTDKNLGIITAIGEKYTVNDMEGNAVTIAEKLNNTVLRNFSPGLGKEYTTTIDKDTWIKLKNGKHTYSIEATDSNNSKSTRVFSFTKNENKIDFTLAKPFTTDIKASKILITPSWELNGATAKIEVCNNGFDVNPTWEDITKQVLINRHYNFTNTTKTSDRWGVNIRIYIEKDQASSAEVSIKGFGGAFE